MFGVGEGGLQLIEGRNRVSILRGRYRHGDFVANRHLTWWGVSLGEHLAVPLERLIPASPQLESSDLSDRGLGGNFDHLAS